MGNRIITTIIGSLFIFFFGSASVSFIKKVFGGRPAIQITAEGFTDNASGVAAGTIGWSHLSGYSIVNAGRQIFLRLHFHNADEFISTRQNRFQQRLMDATNKRYGTPVQIPMKALKTNLILLEEALRPYLHEITD